MGAIVHIDRNKNIPDVHRLPSCTTLVVSSHLPSRNFFRRLGIIAQGPVTCFPFNIPQWPGTSTPVQIAKIVVLTSLCPRTNPWTPSAGVFLGSSPVMTRMSSFPGATASCPIEWVTRMATLEVVTCKVPLPDVPM